MLLICYQFKTSEKNIVITLAKMKSQDENNTKSRIIHTYFPYFAGRKDSILCILIAW